MPLTRVVTIVQCRVGSSRLPGKALRPMCGQPMIKHVLRRAMAMGYDTWVATSINERDSLLADVVWESGVRVFRGSEWDVLERIAGAATIADAEVVVRVTGDCPLLAPDIGRRVVDSFLNSNRDGIATNDTNQSGFPDGLDVEVFSMATLQEAARRATDAKDREHVTPWMRRERPHEILGSSEDWRRVKLSVDTADDFERVRGVMASVSTTDYNWRATRDVLVKRYNLPGGDGWRSGLT